MSDIKDNTMVHKGSDGRTAHFALELLTGLRCPLPEYPTFNAIADYARSVGAHVLGSENDFTVDLWCDIPVVAVVTREDENRAVALFADSVDEIDPYVARLGSPWKVTMIISMLPLMGKE